MAQSDQYVEGALNGMDTGSKIAVALLELFAGGAVIGGAVINNMEKKDAVKVLDKYVKKGGVLLSHNVDVQDAGMFEQLLKAQHIPFVSSIATDATSGEKRAVFLTRDADRLAVDKAFERFAYELKIGLGELSLEEFAKNNEGLNVRSVEGLSAAEMEVFRTHAAKEDIQYAVYEDLRSGTFSIYFDDRDRRAVESTIKRTAYDLSGDRGETYRANIEENIAKKEAFDKALVPKKGQELFVVDRANPNNFIVVTQSGFSTHSLSKEATDKGLVLKDDHAMSFDGVDRADLMKYVGQLRKPVILSKEEMTLVRGIGKDGSLTLVDEKDALQTYRDLQAYTLSRQDYYEPIQVREMLDPEVEVKSLVNLPDALIDKLNAAIMDDGLRQTAVINDTVAYSLTDALRVEKIVDEELYNGLDDKARIEARFHHEGRGSLRFDSKEPQFIIDAKAPNYTFVLDKDNFTIINRAAAEDDPTRTNVFPRDSKAFEATVIPLLQRMFEPVALSKTEYELPQDERLEVIKSRLPENQATLARDAVFNFDAQEREALASGTEIEKPSFRQKKAMELVDKWGEKEYLVDRNFIEKIADHTVDQKIVKERNYRNQEQQSGIDR